MSTKPNIEVISRLAPYFSLWCVWKYQRGATLKPKKPPYGLAGKIATTTPGDWLTFDQARALFEGGGYEGVGILCAGADGTVGFDIDDCLDGHGGVMPWASEHVASLEAMGSYVEVSPSGVGLRGFMRGRVPDGVNEKVSGVGGSLEVYGVGSDRYLTITGNVWPAVSFREIKENQAGIDGYLSRFGYVKLAVEDGEAGAETKKRKAAATATHSDDEIIALLKRNNKAGKITRLMAGDTIDAGGESEAMASVINEIAYYTKHKPQVRHIVETAFSALKRDKWKEKRGDTDFLDYDIGRLVKKCKADYWEDCAAAAKERKASKEQIKKLAADAGEYLIGGPAGIPTVKGGGFASSLHAACELLIRDRRVAGALAFNAFSGETVKLRKMADTFGGKSELIGPVIDSDALVVRRWLESAWGVRLRQEDVNAAIELVSREASFNPVTDKLNSLVWDGVERLPMMLVNYFQASPNTGAGGPPLNARYLSEIGLRWMVATVARAYLPGCKHDSMLVLEGAQGHRKSMSLRALCGAICPDAFTENVPMLNAGGQEAERALSGIWIAEMAELSFLNRAAIEHVKHFLSRTGDRVRNPYGVRYSMQSRTLSFAGTTNEREYIADVTGGRRFWCFKVYRRIDIKTLERDAPQLWAEAVARYKRGEHWYIEDAEIVALAEGEQRQRMTTSSWDDAIMDKLIPELLDRTIAKPGAGADYAAIQAESYRPIELYSIVMGRNFVGAVIPPADATPFGLALRRCGFEKGKRHGDRYWSMGDQLIDRLIAASRPAPPKDDCLQVETI